MKREPAHIQLSPAADGWRIFREGDESPEVVPDIEAAAEKISPGDLITLALPCRAVLVERLRLPTVDTEEIDGMVRLQLEKTLPWPDEIISGYALAERLETESVVLVAALHAQWLDDLCAPLRERQVVPTYVTLYAAVVATVCPKDRTVLLLYQEQDQIVVAVVENGELVYAQTVAAADPQILAAELPPILLTTEMEGVPSDFDAVLLDESCSELRWMGPLLGVPIETVTVATATAGSPIDLLPDAWLHERRKLKRAEQLRSRLIKAGAGVLVLFLFAIGYLAYLQVRVNAVDRKLSGLRPELATVQQRQDRWGALSPAFDAEQYPVEILFQVYQSLPSEEVRITRFAQQLDSFTVEGEAPSARQAIEFADALQKNPALAEYSFDPVQPEILPNEHAQFRVFANR